MATVALTVATLVSGMALANGAAEIAACASLQTWLAFTCCIINHNHQHAPIFRGRAPRFAIDLLLTLARGHTATTVVVPHNFNHHVHMGSPEDWSRPSLAGEGWGLLRIARYLGRASVEMARERSRAGQNPAPVDHRSLPSLKPCLPQEAGADATYSNTALP